MRGRRVRESGDVSSLRHTGGGSPAIEIQRIGSWLTNRSRTAAPMRVSTTGRTRLSTNSGRESTPTGCARFSASSSPTTFPRTPAWTAARRIRSSLSSITGTRFTRSSTSQASGIAATAWPASSVKSPSAMCGAPTVIAVEHTPSGWRTAIPSGGGSPWPISWQDTADLPPNNGKIPATTLRVGEYVRRGVPSLGVSSGTLPAGFGLPAFSNSMRRDPALRQAAAGPDHRSIRAGGRRSVLSTSQNLRG